MNSNIIPNQSNIISCYFDYTVVYLQKQVEKPGKYRGISRKSLCEGHQNRNRKLKTL